ncbi:glucose-1-phosphate adenylyltransferase [Agromyces sp. G08B096]|uniref:Glucose-1-phosphate adenylyltransferase n=1 Tax=Agromyces sp. G08B096 TaxID=3156399 RepID=A0AAU7WC43_9MICO
MAARKVFGIVLAGGEGKRLMPLTEDRAKPAVPFGGQYRLIDFALSNLVNSGLRQIVVLTQYKSHSLDRHVSQTWRLSGMLNAYVASVPAQQRLGKRWFSGSADAILQSLNLIYDEQPDLIVVVGADHVYRMDFSQMVDAHVESGADVTVAAIRQPIALADQFGVIEVDPADPARIHRFLEKPADPVGLPDAPGEVLASMGNYVFDADALIDAVLRDGEQSSSSHDMGGDIIPSFVAQGRAGVYDLQRNDVPGSTDRDRYYWRDVGTIDSFFEAHQDLISVLPVFNLYNREWPIFSQQLNSPPAKFTRDARGSLGTVIDSIVSLGSVISGAHVERSVLGPWAIVGSGAHVADSILFDRARIEAGATVRRAILDKEVVVEEGARIGVDREEDLARGFIVTGSGITVVGKGSRVRAAA